MTPDRYRYFRVEARDLLEQLGKGAMDLERAPRPAELVPRMLRFAHTLKGAARVVKQPEIADLAHAIEDALAPMRDHGLAASREHVRGILEQLDAISSRLAELEPRSEKPGLATEIAPVVESMWTIRADVAEMDALLDGIAEVSVQLRGMSRAAGGVERARRLADLLVEHLARPQRGDDTPSGDRPGSAKTRTFVEELRSTMYSLERTLVGSLELLEREVRQVREATERLRLVPASAVFAPLERIAHDSGSAVGRRVLFEARGGDVRLEAHVLGVVQDALVQIVRNAVAHGIEPEPERTRAGKPAAGMLVLEVARRGNRVAFVCTDDGRGVDLEAVRRIAETKGLTARSRQPDAAELISLLLRGGLTTSATVTQASGRGVGLDVVRESAARLNGQVLVRTETGRGTAFELIVPVSVSSTDVLLVVANGITAAIPRDSVRRALRVASAEIMRTSEGEAILHEGQLIPFVPLARCLAPGSPTPPDRRTWSTVVVDGGTSLAAVGVDRLLGVVNVVLRPLPALAPAGPIVAGASLDAEGNPQIVVDPEALVSAATTWAPSEDLPPVRSRPPILIVDDSLTTRMLERSILESAGYEVGLACSAEEGLEMAHRRRYGLFLVDIEMPGMDGFTFVEKTSSEPALKGIPSILISSRNCTEDRQRGAKAGAVGYITKGQFDQTELLDTIQRLLG